MKWRCAWCGKPHEANDPPCDNCGHGEFEKAVVPLAPESDADDGETITAWVCADCGHEHPKFTPPCDRCGGQDLERREIVYDEEAVVSEMLDEERGLGGPSADVSYLEVLDAKLLFGFVAVALLIAVVAAGMLGYVDVPGIPGPAGPVPGNATATHGLSLSGVEGAYVTELNARRSANGYDNLTVDSRVTDAATYYNQQRVRATYGDGDAPKPKAVGDRLGDACTLGNLTYVSYSVRPGDAQFDSAHDLARTLVAARLHSDGAGQFATPPHGLVGVDVHQAPDGAINVTQFSC
ncbi:MAG: hypothetical protein ABEJ31_05185 [Haloarculaceae archaeon]